jgi:hypothetical protein
VVARLLDAGADVYHVSEKTLRQATADGHDALVARLRGAGANANNHNWYAQQIREATVANRLRAWIERN